MPELSEQQLEVLSKLVALRKVERDLNKNFEMFGGSGKLTISDATRNMSPQLKEFIDKWIDEHTPVA